MITATRIDAQHEERARENAAAIPRLERRIVELERQLAAAKKLIGELSVARELASNAEEP
jgi:hypothetical protein